MRALIFFACFLATAGTAAALERRGRVELTPYAAYRFGGTFDERDGDRDFALEDAAARGLIANFGAAGKDGQWEASYARQATTLETALDGAELALDVGVLLRAERRVGVRLEGRAFATFLDQDGATGLRPARPARRKSWPSPLAAAQNAPAAATFRWSASL